MSEITIPFDALVKILKAPDRDDITITTTFAYIARHYSIFISLAIKRSGINVLDYVAHFEEDVRGPILRAANQVSADRSIDIFKRRTAVMECVNTCKQVRKRGGSLDDAISDLTNTYNGLAAEARASEDHSVAIKDAITRYGITTGD